MADSVGVSARASPEDWLRKATRARSPVVRAKYAKRGLEQEADATTRAMLLRQLYLAHMEGRRFDDAAQIAEEMVQSGVMPDVARQDAARAQLGLGERGRAVEELRIASRVSPASRRAFHLWTLGSVLYLSGRFAEACAALERAARWGTTDKPLYEAQLLLARRASDQDCSPDELRLARRRLEDAACGQGYGQFVLGELAHAQGDHEAARTHLRSFVRRATGGRVALAVALEGEVARARELLAKIQSY